MTGGSICCSIVVKIQFRGRSIQARIRILPFGCKKWDFCDRATWLWHQYRRV